MPLFAAMAQAMAQCNALQEQVDKSHAARSVYKYSGSASRSRPDVASRDEPGSVTAPATWRSDVSAETEAVL